MSDDGKHSNANMSETSDLPWPESYISVISRTDPLRTALPEIQSSILHCPKVSSSRQRLWFFSYVRNCLLLQVGPLSPPLKAISRDAFGPVDLSHLITYSSRFTLASIPHPSFCRTLDWLWAPRSRGLFEFYFPLPNAMHTDGAVQILKTSQPDTSMVPWNPLNPRQFCWTLTISELSEGVTAESGPSVVVWELSLMGEEACVPPFRSTVASDWMALIWLELLLRASSSASPLLAVLDRSQLAKSDSDCNVCWERGCSVMMSCPEESAPELPTDPAVDTPDEEAISLASSLFIEAEKQKTTTNLWPFRKTPLNYPTTLWEAKCLTADHLLKLNSSPSRSNFSVSPKTPLTSSLTCSCWILTA